MMVAWIAARYVSASLSAMCLLRACLTFNSDWLALYRCIGTPHLRTSSRWKSRISTTQQERLQVVSVPVAIVSVLDEAVDKAILVGSGLAIEDDDGDRPGQARNSCAQELE